MRAKKIDNNQAAIVKALSQIPGVSVEVGHDDILVGYSGHTLWYELKDPIYVSSRTGDIYSSQIKPSQKRLVEEWTGHYKIVWSLDQILDDLSAIRVSGMPRP